MIRLAIVEDEQVYVDQLQQYLERYSKESGEEFKVTVYPDGAEILDGYSGKFDIIFMDIQMKYMDGMTTAEEIRKIDREVVLMFITNMVQYAVRGYAVDAMDYIIKPVEYFSFSQKLGRACERITSRKDYFLIVPVEDGVKKLKVSEIYYVESQGHTLIFHTKEGNFSSRRAMKELEETMIPYSFFRSNKGYLVNMKYVDAVKDNCCIICGEELVISRAKRKAFMEALVSYMNEVVV